MRFCVFFNKYVTRKCSRGKFYLAVLIIVHLFHTSSYVFACNLQFFNEIVVLMYIFHIFSSVIVIGCLCNNLHVMSMSIIILKQYSLTWLAFCNIVNSLIHNCWTKKIIILCRCSWQDKSYRKKCLQNISM